MCVTGVTTMIVGDNNNLYLDGLQARQLGLSPLLGLLILDNPAITKISFFFYFNFSYKVKRNDKMIRYVKLG